MSQDFEEAVRELEAAVLRVNQNWNPNEEPLVEVVVDPDYEGRMVAACHAYSMVGTGETRADALVELHKKLGQLQIVTGGIPCPEPLNSAIIATNRLVCNDELDSVDYDGDSR